MMDGIWLAAKVFVGIKFLEIVAQRLEFTIAHIKNVTVYLMLACRCND
jgi:hypothetical protein